MKIKLKDIASIQTGIFAQTIINGDVMCLQAKHFDENGLFLRGYLPDLSLNTQTKKHLLHHGDLLFCAKGSKNFATIYESKNGNCVASSTFLVIRLKENISLNVLPEFLVWFLNLSKTQEILKSKARGSGIPSISKVELQEIDIEIPSIEKQQIIIKIFSLSQKENSIVRQIQIMKDLYLQTHLINLIKE